MKVWVSFNLTMALINILHDDPTEHQYQKIADVDIVLSHFF